MGDLGKELQRKMREAHATGDSEEWSRLHNEYRLKVELPEMTHRYLTLSSEDKMDVLYFEATGKDRRYRQTRSKEKE